MTQALKKSQAMQETRGVWEDFVAANPAAQWIQDARRSGYAVVEQQGLPNKRSERYKYTDIAAVDAQYALPFAATQIAQKGETRFVTKIDDNAPQWAKDLAKAAPAGEAQYKDMALWHAANAYLRDGVVIDVPKNTRCTTPLEITITGSDGESFVPRTFIRVGENAELTIIETHTGSGVFWNNRLSQIVLEKGARLRHYRIQENPQTAIYTQNTHVALQRDATYEAFVLTTGSALSRNQIHVDLKGENAEARLGGLNLLQGSQHADTTITIEHQAPHCRSNQTYKNILNDKAHGVFQGKVHVHQIAQKTDGYQLANTLLLSPTAVMDTKPELEIYADDVKCSHGSTTGQMDTAPLFYLRTRGLNEAQAKLLLMQAFLGPALEEIRDESVRETFAEKAFAWLEEQSRA